MTIEFFKMDHVFIRIWHGSGEGESSSELDIIWHEIILAALKYVMFRGIVMHWMTGILERQRCPGTGYQ